MNEREARAIIQANPVGYTPILNVWGTTKIEVRGRIIEMLFSHAQQTDTTQQFLEAIIYSSYALRPQHGTRERQVLSEIAKGWIDYADRIRYFESAAPDNGEFKREEKINTANIEVFYKINKYHLLRTALRLLGSAKRKNQKDVVRAVYSAFDLGHKAALDFLRDKGYGIFNPESKFEDVYSLHHEDEGYKPAIQEAKRIFENRASGLERLIAMGLVSQSQADSYKQDDFEISIGDEGFSYLMCISFAERIRALETMDIVRIAKGIFSELYQTAIFAFHLAIKEKVEKQKRLHSSIFSNLDLTVYRQFHET